MSVGQEHLFPTGKSKYKEDVAGRCSFPAGFTTVGTVLYTEFKNRLVAVND